MLWNDIIRLPDSEINLLSKIPPMTSEHREYREYAEAAVEIATSAGALLLDQQAKMQQVEWKDWHHMKTQADDASDAYIRNEIMRRFPGHNIFSEELPDRNLGNEISWVVDPLDGTIPFAMDISDHFGVSIGVTRGNHPISGAINLPRRNKLYRAQEGIGAFANDGPIHVADIQDVHKAIIGIDYGKIERQKSLPIIDKLLSRQGVAYPVTYGSAASALSLVAEGRLHGYLSTNLEPWDMAAAVVLIREAGGKVTDLKGQEWELGAESIIASNPGLHRQILELLKGQ